MIRQYGQTVVNPKPYNIIIILSAWASKISSYNFSLNPRYFGVRSRADPRGLLMSESLEEKMYNKSPVRSELIRNIRLKGKEQTINIYSVEMNETSQSQKF